ncbi:MAG TPA: hypothetical protein VGM20_07060 [Gemmatimonadales bacterium]|jgi:hypothetical protein
MRYTRLLVAGLLGLAAACSSTDNTAPGTSTDDAQINGDISAAAADGFAEDINVISGMDGQVGSTASINGGADIMGRGGWRPGLTGCSFVGGSFNCPATLKNGLNVTRTITFLDANSQDQTGYDSLLTASIHVLAEVSGDRTNGPWSATVDRHRDFTVTGLLGSETSRTVNGTGNETVERSRDTKNERAYDLTCSSTITDVVLPVRDDGGNGWPTAGTITRTCTINVTAGPNAGKTVTRTVTITFGGSSDVTATIGGATFTINLGTGTSSLTS